MKLSDLFKSKKKKEEPESQAPKQEDPKIFEQAESYTSILENIDEEEDHEFRTEDLNDIVSEGERIIGRKREEEENKENLLEESLFTVVEVEEKPSEELSPIEEELESAKNNLESREPTQEDFRTGPIFDLMQRAQESKTEEKLERETDTGPIHDIRIMEKFSTQKEELKEPSEKTRKPMRRDMLFSFSEFKEVREEVEEPVPEEEPTTGFIIIEDEKLEEVNEAERLRAKREVEAKKRARRPLLETQEILALTGEVEKEEPEEKPNRAQKIRTRSAFEEVLELKRKKRALEARNEIKKPEVKEAEKTRELKTLPSREKRFSFSNLFKRKKKASKEKTKVLPEIKRSEPLEKPEVPVEPVIERAPETKKAVPRRRRRSELLLNKTQKPEEPSEKTETIELSIVDETKEPPKTESLLEALEAKPVLEESLKESIRDTLEISEVPEEPITQRNKNIKRQLQREERVSRERGERKVQELTQNIRGVEGQPLIFSKVPDNILKGGIVLFNNLARQMQSSGTLRIESLFSVLGSLAGYSIQAGIREKMVNRMGLSEDQVFSVIETKNNDRYFFGDPIDRSLQKEKSSLWYMTAGATQRLSGRVETNIDEVVRYTYRNLGKESFGIPRLPKNHRPNHTPQYYVEHMWEALVPGLERFTDDPLQWYLIFSVSLQRALICAKDLINPNAALRIIIESAVPMSVANIMPLKPSELAEESENKPDISVLRKEIEFIRKTLDTNLPQEQRSVLIKELSFKTEQLYDLLESENKPGDMRA